jgi:TRAP-type uncharacterized transport system substrate-binding protein
MSLSQSAQFVYNVVEAAIIVGAIVTAIVYGRRNGVSKIKKSDEDDQNQAQIELVRTVNALKTQNTLQAEKMDQQDKTISENSQAITELSGQIKTLKDVPLEKIEKHMADTNKILQALIPLIPTLVEHTVTESTKTRSS